MSSFRLSNSFRLQKNKQGCQTLKPTSKKPFHHVSRDKILNDSSSISPWPGVSPTAILNEEKVLGTRLGRERPASSRPQSPRSFWSAPRRIVGFSFPWEGSGRGNLAVKGAQVGGRVGELVRRVWNAPFIYHAYDFCPCLN